MTSPDRQSRSVRGRLVVPAFALIALGAFVHACGGGGGGGGDNPPAPPVPPGPSSFLSTTQFPANGANPVPLAPLVLIGFNDVVNATTVNNTSVTLTETVSGNPVPSAVTYIPCNNRVQMVPNLPLLALTNYTVSLTSALQDDDGESLTPISRTFTTGGGTDGVRPAFVPGGYTAMATSTTQIDLNWSPATDDVDSAGQISYDIYMSQTGCYSFDAPVASTAPGANTITIGLAPPLIPRTTYNFIVRPRDSAGNSALNGDEVTATTFTSFSVNVRTVVTTLCVGCHQPGGTAAQAPYFINMNYTTDALNYTSWLGAGGGAATQCGGGTGGGFPSRVVPGDAANSFLWQKISAATTTAACGERMPFQQPALSTANQAVIFDWIQEGAQNN